MGGTTPSFESKEVYAGKNYGQLATTERTNYSFLGWSLLPNEYQQLEYIESTGGQYIKTTILPKDTIGFYMKLSSSDITTDTAFFGSSDNDKVARYWVGNENNKIYYGWNKLIYTNFNIQTNKTYEIKMNYLNNRKDILNNEIIGDITETLETANTYPIYIFAANKNGSVTTGSKIKLYEFKISDGTNLIHNFVPCYRKSDGVVGLYDIVEKTFYTNAGTGTFVKGNNAEYVTSSTKVAIDMNHTLYANWGYNPIVTIDAKGGTIQSIEGWTNSSNNELSTKRYVYNSKYGTLPTLTKNGYTFLGWRKYTLPNIYQAVEYIESNGGQYIDTGVIPTNTTGVYAKLSSSNISPDLVYFGSRSTTDGRFWVGNNKSQIYYGWNTITTRTTNITLDTVNIIKMNYLNNRKSTFNDEVIRDIGSTSLISNTQPIYILAGNDNGSAKYHSSIKLYEFIITDGNEIIHNYIPCYRKSDGVIGLYDLVGGGFYTNDGSGTLGKGSDIEYIQLSNDILNITPDTKLIINEDHTLYAVWGYNPTVTFDANGGTVNISTKTYTFNSNYGELPIPTRSGYTFVGWKSRRDNYILSNEYQEVEYIESNGTQYINTEVVPSNTTGVYSKLSSSNISSDLIYFGSRSTNNGRFWVGNTNSRIYYGWNDNTYRSTNITRDTVNIIKMNYLNNRKSMFNDEIVKDIGSTTLIQNTSPIYVFAGNDNGTARFHSSIKLYEFRITDGNKIIHHYIPCYRTSDDVMGLCDIVGSNYFIYNQSFSFGKGNNVSVVTPSTQLLTNEDHILYAIWEEKITASVSGNPTEWTNQDVTLTVNTNLPDRVKEYSFDGGTTWQTSNEKTYTVNTNDISIKIKDINDNIIDVEEVDITKIDKVLPTINQTENNIIVTLDESNSINDFFTSSDNESGINTSSFKVYRNNIALQQCTDEITNTNYFDYPGLYSIETEVKDNAGNIQTLVSQVLVRWPKAGKYVVRKTELDGAGIVGTGLATDSSKMGLYRDNADTGLDTTLPFSSKYYYAGKTVNNYFTFNPSDSKKTFRIFNVSVDDEIKLVGSKSSGTIRYGTHAQAKQGFLNTELYQTFSALWPSKQFYIDNADKITFTDSEWAHINEKATYYIGGFRGASSTSIASTIDCERNGDNDWTKATSFTGYSAFPNVSDYLKTSNQMGTVYSFSTSSHYMTFANNSWISEGITINASDSQWTINGGSGGTLHDKYFYYFMYGN